MSQTEPDHMQTCKTINNKIHKLIHTTKAITSYDSLDIDQMIHSIDPVLWDAICIITQNVKPNKKPEESITKNTRRLFILHQIMFCMDNRCSMPFHVLNVDLIDCYGGSAELLKIFNRLGVCVSFDTLSRHIQTTVEEINDKGLLQGLDPNALTMFSLDNIDFLHSNAQVFCGNQQLSWHGTTVQGHSN